jgi:hypothetical protein
MVAAENHHFSVLARKISGRPPGASYEGLYQWLRMTRIDQKTGTLIVYLEIFLLFSPTIIYSIYVFYINSNL